MRPRRLFPLAVAACLSMPFVIFAQPQYTVHDVGTLGGSSSQATGVNNSGQVVGGSTTVNSLAHPFRTAANSAINPARSCAEMAACAFSSETNDKAARQQRTNTRIIRFLCFSACVVERRLEWICDIGWRSH